MISLSSTQLDGLQELIFLDRYALKDVDEKNLNENDVVVALVEDHPVFPRREVGRIKAKNGVGVDVELKQTGDVISLETYRVDKPLELYPEQMWERVASAMVEVEPEEKRDRVKSDFLWALRDFRFVPGGRIMAAAGTNHGKTMINCFVLPSPKDSRRGILKTAGDMIEIMAKGGGVGLTISSLRPRSARVYGVNGRSNGSVAWGELYSMVTLLVNQDGGRRGALMLAMNDWHPDLMEFIRDKKKPGRKEGCNMSVLVSDRFMRALKNDELWTFVFPDYEKAGMDVYDEEWDGCLETWVAKGHPVKTYGRLPAREIWDEIMQSAWESGEPGVIFIERANKMANSYYYTQIVGSNPCLTGEMRLLTKDGYKPIKSLVGEVDLVNKDGEVVKAAVWETGKKEIVRLRLSDGRILRCTPDHRFMTVSGEEVQAKDLKGKRLMPNITYAQDVDQYFVKLGFIQGDGELNRLNDEKFPSHKGLAVNFGAADWELLRLFDGDDYSVSQRRIYLKGFNEKLLSFGFFPARSEERRFPSSYRSWSKTQKRSFLRGCYSAKGSVIKRGRVAYKTTSRIFAEELMETLKNDFGVSAYITTNKSRVTKFENGEYRCRESYDVNIAEYRSVQTFFEEIGFELSYREEQLKDLLVRKAPVVLSVEADGVDVVYDFSEPKTNWGIVEGFVAHNCGEQMLPPNGVCCLGSIVLPRFVDERGVRWDELRRAVHTAVRFLDNVIDTTPYVLDEIREWQASERRIGLGTMGLGEMLLTMKLRYGSPESLEFVDELYKFIAVEAYRASVHLAIEKGPFPRFDRDAFLASGFMKKMPEEIRRMVWKHGIRNVALLTQAPTGSIGTMVGTSTGIEPFYSWEYFRKGRFGKFREEVAPVKEWRRQNPGASLPEYFVTAMDMTPEEHMAVQAAVQRWVDASISKTVNAPSWFSVEDTKKAYEQAYELGCKGLTVYRDGSREEQVLSIEEMEEEEGELKEVASSCGLVIGPNGVEKTCSL